MVQSEENAFTTTAQAAMQYFSEQFIGKNIDYIMLQLTGLLTRTTKGFKDETAKENVKQLLKQLSPETEMKVS